MLRALFREIEELLTMFAEGLGLMIGSGLGLAAIVGLGFLAWEIFARLI